MRFYKVMIGAAFSGAVALTAGITASAYSPAQGLSVSNVVEQAAIGNNDPEYAASVVEEKKSAGGQAMAVWGSGDITHNSKYANSPKTYGIDVSYYQYTIDWDKVKKSGVQFAIIRAGYRGWGSSGSLVEDNKFKENLLGAKKAGLKVGVYFYTQAITSAEVKEEANFCINLLKKYGVKPDLPIYYDIESVYTGTSDVGRLDAAGLSKAQTTQNCKTFCDTVKKAGYKSGVYSYYSFMTGSSARIDGPALGKNYDVWLAHYTNKTDYPGEYTTWQYSSSGQVPGISTRTDMNVRYVNDPNAPKPISYDFSLVSHTHNSISFKWSEQDDAAGYVVQRKNSSGEFEDIARATSTQFEDTQLNYGTVYEYKVVPFYNDGDDGMDGFVEGVSRLGTPSESFKAGTRNKTCEKFSVKYKGDGSVELKWYDPNPKADTYDILSYDKDTKKYTTIKVIKPKVDNKNKSAVITGLKGAKIHSLSVRANYLLDGKYILSNICTPVDFFVSPNEVKEFNVKFMPDGKATVKWSTNEDVNFDVRLKNGVEISDLAENTDEPAIELNGLKDGQDYTISVRSRVSYDGKVYYSDYADYTFKYGFMGTKTVTPVNSYSPSSTTVSWSKVLGASSYDIYRYDNNKRKFVFVKNVAGDVYKTTITKLKSNTGYRFRVYPKFGSYTYQKSAECTAYTTSSAPKGLRLTAVSRYAARFRWNKSPNATSYRVYVYDYRRKLLKTRDFKTTSCRIALKRNKVYYVKVKGINSKNKKVSYLSLFSGKVKFKTRF